MTRVLPFRGEIWMANLSPTVGHEHSGRRPILVVSHNLLNHGPAFLVIGIPLTSRQKGAPLHVAVSPPEGGLTVPSYILTEAVRSLSTERLVFLMGSVKSGTLAAVERKLCMVLGMGPRQELT